MGSDENFIYILYRARGAKQLYKSPVIVQLVLPLLSTKIGQISEPEG